MHFWKLNDFSTENWMILARKIKKSKDFLQIFGMWKHFLDILWNSDKIWWSCSANRRENCKILTMLFEILWKNAKIRDENFLKYWGLSGAKACKSCRSRQELSNEYSFAKIGFDTAENEPFNFHNFSSLQGFDFDRPVAPRRWRCRMCRASRGQPNAVAS